MAFGIPMLAGLFGNGQQPQVPQTGTLNLGGQQKQVTLPQGIQAPKDRGMFGRFNGFNPFRFEETGVNPIYALGAALAGGAADSPMVTAQLIGQKQDAFRQQQEKQAEEAKRQKMLEQLGNMPGVTDQQRALLSMGLGTDQLAEQAFAPTPNPKDRYGVINDQVVSWDDPTKPLADYRTPEAAQYSNATLSDGVYAVNQADPTDKYRLGDAPARTPLVQNTVNMPDQKGETKFQEGLGTNAANSYQDVLEQGRAAGGAIGNLDTMETLLDGIDYTGLGGNALLNIQRVGAMFGADIPDLAPKEALKRLSSQMALSLKQDLPGPMSNADREFLLSIPPNLNVSPTGNDAILFILRKREERKQDMMRSLIEANPQTMDEYRTWENSYLQTAPPMFNPATQASLLAALSGASGEDTPQ